MRVRERLSKLKAYPAYQLLKIKQELKREGKRIYDFGTGDPREPTPEFIRKALISSVPKVSQYPTVKGKESLREAIASWLKRRFNVSLDPDSQIIPSSGSKEAIFHFPLVFLREEKPRVIFGQPAYPVYERATIFAGGIPTPVELDESDGFLLRLDKLKPEILKQTSIVFLNYPHNPTGAVAPKEYLKDMWELSKEFGFILANDECYVDVYFEGKAPNSLLEVADSNAVTFHSLSKRSGMTGYRSGFIAGDRELIQSYLKFRTNFGVASQEFVQSAAEAAWSDDKHVAERNKIFFEKSKIIKRLFRELNIYYLDSNATFYVWAKVPQKLSSIRYAEILAKAGIIVSPGVFFGQNAEGWFRVALVPSIDDCLEAAKVWKKVHRGL